MRPSGRRRDLLEPAKPLSAVAKNRHELNLALEQKRAKQEAAWDAAAARRTMALEARAGKARGELEKVACAQEQGRSSPHAAEQKKKAVFEKLCEASARRGALLNERAHKLPVACAFTISSFAPDATRANKPAANKPSRALLEDRKSVV